MGGARERAWDAPAQRLCWLARQYAYLFGEEYVGTEHLLLAATEVTPADWHGYAGLTPEGVRDGLEALAGQRGGFELDQRRPTKLTPRAREVLRRAAERAATRGRPVSCRDVWLGLLGDPEGLAYELLTRLQVVPERLRERLIGPAAAPDGGTM